MTAGTLTYARGNQIGNQIVLNSAADDERMFQLFDAARVVGNPYPALTLSIDYADVGYPVQELVVPQGTAFASDGDSSNPIYSMIIPTGQRPPMPDRYLADSVVGNVYFAGVRVGWRRGSSFYGTSIEVEFTDIDNNIYSTYIFNSQLPRFPYLIEIIYRGVAYQSDFGASSRFSNWQYANTNPIFFQARAITALRAVLAADATAGTLQSPTVRLIYQNNPFNEPGSISNWPAWERWDEPEPIDIDKINRDIENANNLDLLWSGSTDVTTSGTTYTFNLLRSIAPYSVIEFIMYDINDKQWYHPAMPRDQIPTTNDGANRVGSAQDQFDVWRATTNKTLYMSPKAGNDNWRVHAIYGQKYPTE